ncbi:methylated-DNA--[protein]-cysteine S-methyltransferase [Schaalia georgiae]|nr:methylated-DNA--[protein]-cysteine S-methyltransferase [Schaalia georgiae]
MRTKTFPTSDDLAIAIHRGPLGPMTLAAHGGTLVGAWFYRQRFFGAPYGVDEAVVGFARDAEDPALRAADAWLNAYYSGSNPPLDFPLRAYGNDFQLRVWDALLRVPYGTTTSYGKLAEALTQESQRPQGTNAQSGNGGKRAAHRTAAASRPVSPRVVGWAVGRNPISLFVPCHRVLSASGGVSGYAGGVDRKEWLLALESGRVVAGLFGGVEGA